MHSALTCTIQMPSDNNYNRHIIIQYPYKYAKQIQLFDFQQVHITRHVTGIKVMAIYIHTINMVYKRWFQTCMHKIKGVVWFSTGPYMGDKPVYLVA